MILREGGEEGRGALVGWEFDRVGEVDLVGVAGGDVRLDFFDSGGVGVVGDAESWVGEDGRGGRGGGGLKLAGGSGAVEGFGVLRLRAARFAQDDRVRLRRGGEGEIRGRVE